jgi:hypothetical protein
VAFVKIRIGLWAIQRMTWRELIYQAPNQIYAVQIPQGLHVLPAKQGQIALDHVVAKGVEREQVYPVCRWPNKLEQAVAHRDQTVVRTL